MTSQPIRILALVALAVLALLPACSLRSGSPDVDPGAPRQAPPEAEAVAGQGTEPPLLEREAIEEDELPVALPPDPEHTITPADPAPEERISEAPHDVLAEVDPELSAAQAARARDEVGDPPEPTFDVPIEINKKVLGWIDYYAHRNPEAYQRGLVRSGAYIDMFREIFAEAGIPQDLVYMAHVESAYKTSAYSRAKAKGIFQFIYGTGRRYGLRIDYWVDERSDPEKSARAAAAYLTDLYEEFGDWYLALAGYNAGEGKVRRAIKRTGKRDFWSIARTRYLRAETKNYVPAILASILISKEPHKYGFEFEPDPPLTYETVEIEGAADLKILARCAGSDLETLRRLNPALRRLQTPPDGTTALRVPHGVGATLLAELEKIPAGDRVLYARHRVRGGETLSTIARRYGSSVSAIQSANGMGRRTLIRIGQTLKVPSGSYAGQRYAMADAPSPGSDGVVRYRVRRGDSLWRIAQLYGTTPGRIASQNGISVHGTLRVGQLLTIGGAAAPASVDSSWTATYRVRRGDTLSEIAERYGTGPSRLARENGISLRSTLRIGQRLRVPGGAPAATAAKVSGSAEPVTVTVRRGDSLWKIAQRYDTTVDAIAALNGIPTRATLSIGQKLRVAPGVSGTAVVHRVRRGDSLWKIAQRYDTSVSELCALNGINPRSTLRPGTTLTVRSD